MVLRKWGDEIEVWKRRLKRCHRADGREERKTETQDGEGHCQEVCLCHPDVRTKALISYFKMKISWRAQYLLKIVLRITLPIKAQFTSFHRVTSSSSSRIAHRELSPSFHELNGLQRQMIFN